MSNQAKQLLVVGLILIAVFFSGSAYLDHREKQRIVREQKAFIGEWKEPTTPDKVF